MQITQMSSRGQVVIPAGIRKALGLKQGTALKVELEGNSIVLEPLASAKDSWQAWEGVLAGTGALQQHLAEHAREVEQDE